MRLSEWVRKARLRADMTQEQFGEMMGVTKANVSGWENERHEPSFDQIVKISEATGEPLPLKNSNVTLVPHGKRLVPVLDHVQAGSWTGVVDSRSESDILEYVSTSVDLSGSAFAMVVRGESMLPEFREGDMIIVDPEEEPRPGDCVVAVNGSGEATFKRYRERGVNEAGQNVFELVPLNPDYPTMRSDVTHIRIIGTVVEQRKFRRK